MGEPYVGEIRMFGGNYAPVNWAFCHGQEMEISEYQTLYSLIGTTYGGDGVSRFALPDLRSRVPIHMRNAGEVAMTGGVEEVTLTIQQIPSHTHAAPVSTTAASSRSAVGGIPANLPAEVAWAAATPDETLGSTSVAGGSQPHTNLQPYLGINFIIALHGPLPST